MSRWQQHNIKPRLGPSNMGLCHKLQGGVPMKLAPCHALRVFTTAGPYGGCPPIKL